MEGKTEFIQRKSQLSYTTGFTPIMPSPVKKYSIHTWVPDQMPLPHITPKWASLSAVNSMMIILRRVVRGLGRKRDRWRYSKDIKKPAKDKEAVAGFGVGEGSP